MKTKATATRKIIASILAMVMCILLVGCASSSSLQRNQVENPKIKVIIAGEEYFFPTYSTVEEAREHLVRITVLSNPNFDINSLKENNKEEVNYQKLISYCESLPSNMIAELQLIRAKEEEPHHLSYETTGFLHKEGTIKLDPDGLPFGSKKYFHYLVTETNDPMQVGCSS